MPPSNENDDAEIAMPDRAIGSRLRAKIRREESLWKICFPRSVDGRLNILSTGRHTVGSDRAAPVSH